MSFKFEDPSQLKPKPPKISRIDPVPMDIEHFDVAPWIVCDMSECESLSPRVRELTKFTLSAWEAIAFAGELLKVANEAIEFEKQATRHYIDANLWSKAREK